jgi:hypothetical protein
MTLQNDMDTLMQGLKPRVSAGMIRGKRIQYNASTTLTVATHKALAPSGYELAGWEVVAIGGGAAGRGDPGLGGWREQEFVPIDWLGAATTVAITVGLGGTASGSNPAAIGGTSSFGPYVTAIGGEVGNYFTPDLSWPLIIINQSTSYYPFQEGANPCWSTPSGFRGAAGGIETSDAFFRRGGASYPIETSMNGLPTSSPFRTVGTGSSLNASSASNVKIAFQNGVGNPNQSIGAAGHAGIGDWCGGGGNGADGTGTNGGAGGFPGGGGGGSGSGVNGPGGNGTVIVYPWFRKVLPA